MDELLGTIQAFGFEFTPRGWAQCSGQLLPISTNTALFSLLGTSYGGDGRTTFALPDLRGRSMIHQGTGPGLTTRLIGQRSGHENVTLTPLNMPTHSHALVDGIAHVNTVTNTSLAASSGPGVNDPEEGSYTLGAGGAFPSIYSESASADNSVKGVNSASQSVISGNTTNSGGNQGFDIMNPFLVVNICIATIGVYPSRE